MPCRDYESDSYDDSSAKLKAQADKLARIACKIMDALVKEGKEDFVLLQDDEVRQWWAQHQAADAKEKARVKEQKRRERVKRNALAKLSDEEKKLLGISIVKTKAVDLGEVDSWDEEDEEIVRGPKPKTISAEETLRELRARSIKR